MTLAIAVLTAAGGEKAGFGPTCPLQNTSCYLSSTSTSWKQVEMLPRAPRLALAVSPALHPDATGLVGSRSRATDPTGDARSPLRKASAEEDDV